MRSPPFVEVIVLTHNNKKVLSDCLRSLAKTSYKNLQITIVDQCSNDGTSAFVKKRYPKFNLVRNNKNYSFAEANNRILKKSRAKYCILLNDDTIQDKKWVSNLVLVAENNADIAALQPKVRSLINKKKFDHAGAGGGFIDIFGYEFCRGRIFFDIEEDRGQYDDEIEVFWVCGVAMLLKMDIIKKIGYLDETFGSYFEETDLCWRINSRGYKQRYVPSSVVCHIGSASWGKKKNSMKKEYLLHRNSWLVILKNYSRVNWIWLIPIKLTMELATIGAFIFKNPRKSLAAFRGIIWAIFNIIMVFRKSGVNQKGKLIGDWKLIQRMAKTSIILQYFILGKKEFREYEKYLT